MTKQTYRLIYCRHSLRTRMNIGFDFEDENKKIICPICNKRVKE